jgi:hypothetical protein
MTCITIDLNNASSGNLETATTVVDIESVANTVEYFIQPPSVINITQVPEAPIIIGMSSPTPIEIVVSAEAPLVIVIEPQCRTTAMFSMPDYNFY